MVKIKILIWIKSEWILNNPEKSTNSVELNQYQIKNCIKFIGFS